MLQLVRGKPEIEVADMTVEHLWERIAQGQAGQLVGQRNAEHLDVAAIVADLHNAVVADEDGLTSLEMAGYQVDGRACAPLGQYHDAHLGQHVGVFTQC